MLKAEILGQLLLMQSMLIHLPDEKSIFSFVCRGLLDISGIATVNYTETSDSNTTNTIRFPIKNKGEFHLYISDYESFVPYEDYLRNFFFMIEVILEERHQRQLNKLHQLELEHKVQERTKQLQEEIDERKEVEKLLKHSEQLFRTSFECATAGVCLVDLDGSFKKINPMFCQLLGYTEGELLAKKFNDIAYLEDKATGNAIIEELLSGKINYANFENRYVCKNGNLIAAYVSTAMVCDASQKPQYFITYIQDITNRVKAEKELADNEQKLKEQNEEYEALNEELNERNRELLKAKEKAEESDHLKTAFLQNMSHEVRTPMNAIIGFSGLLNKSNLSPEKQKNYTSIIQNSTHQLLSIITDILAISAIETKQEKVKIEKVYLNDIIYDLQAIFESQARAKKIEFFAKKSLSDAKSEIYTDKTKLNQILTNLITNALKFTNEGFIEFGYYQRDSNLEFYVKDTGIGIAKEQQKHIFERFRQADASIAPNYGGTGLGLSISKGFVELLEGKIWVQSQLEHGSTFYFTIPFKPVGEKINPIILDKHYEKGATILVAEDEEYNYLFVEELLTNMDYQLIHAKNGVETVKICKENPDINLILMDIKMPLLDGHSAAKLIKEFRPDLPIIAQSAYALENEREKYKGKAFDSFLTKPLNADELKQQLDFYIH